MTLGTRSLLMDLGMKQETNEAAFLNPKIRKPRGKSEVADRSHSFSCYFSVANLRLTSHFDPPLGLANEAPVKPYMAPIFFAVQKQTPIKGIDSLSPTGEERDESYNIG
jgi:hypothetical protein